MNSGKWSRSRNLDTWGDQDRAEELTTDGDWRHIPKGESILLRAFDDDNNLVGELEFVPNP